MNMTWYGNIGVRFLSENLGYFLMSCTTMHHHSCHRSACTIRGLAVGSVLERATVRTLEAWRVDGDARKRDQDWLSDGVRPKPANGKTIGSGKD